MQARPLTSKSPTLKSYGSLPSAPLTGKRARDAGCKKREEGQTYTDVSKTRDDSEEQSLHVWTIEKDFKK